MPNKGGSNAVDDLTAYINILVTHHGFSEPDHIIGLTKLVANPFILVKFHLFIVKLKYTGIYIIHKVFFSI